ncbi:ATP-binding protein [Cellulophaga sp. Hel_I_12]|uniref:ATP-binding protein n=1 Tax=Cellulophaga sp. Hel_I_12 TaxID=1249972 RepID=UPI000646EF72|nr:ATP-binding protein [Cellulophaga sp. Hel_I_12]
MNFKKFISSTQLYVVLIISAISMLVILGSVSYTKTAALKAASDAVSHTLVVEKEINKLFAIYSEMESAQLKNLLQKDTLTYNASFQKLTIDAENSFATLKKLVSDSPVQINHLERVQELQKSLTNALGLIPNSQRNTIRLSKNLISKIDDVAHIMAELNQRKKFMLSTEDAQLQERKKEYESQAFLTPVMILLLGLFALLVFIISFLKINRERKNRTKAEAFLANVLAHTENIINYYDPVYDDENRVVDFRVKYANERNKIDLNLDPEKMKGKLLSEVMPFVKLHGEYEKLISAFTEQKFFNLNRQVQLNGEVIWLESNIRPMAEGLLVVAKNTSFEKESVARLNDLNEKLREQYEELKDTEEFLQSVIKSTNNVVSYFRPVRDASNQIIDFTILYTNEEVKNATGDLPVEILNKNISEVYPFLMKNGVFEIFVEAIQSNQVKSYERSYNFNENIFWFDTYVIKTGDGICVTSRNITKQKDNEQKILIANEQLNIQNSILKEAKRIAKIASFRWNYEENDFEPSTISENLFDLLGYDANEFNAEHSTFKKLIHPDDLANYESELKKAFEQKNDVNFSYRIISKNNKIKHFKTTGNFQGSTLVGVIQDVTSQIKGAQKLREKNQELVRSNAELESFNRVASHDLQEPIRKIQMFVSRIADNDLDKMSDKSKDFFEKINSSSERMRLLIKYLLSYSRINTSKNDFAEVDLHDILDKVQEDLEDRIKESEVSITVDELPTVSAIPFQMEQLFNNLISNAIKYKGIEDPKIIIACKKLNRNEITDDFIKKSKWYYRISVLDNGIGFDQEHSEKIFELFQRLHQKNEYSGTGIGLAICKKIVQNHKGHIIAESELGKGAAFCFYLPAQ